MNARLKQMMRQKRQAEGRRPREPDYPPVGENANFPPTFAFHRNTEVPQRQWRDLPPAYEYNALEELPTAHQGLAQSLDASNPTDSDFYTEGNKIRPWAHVRVPAYLAISEWESVSRDEFPDYGLKLGALGHVVPQQVGGQNSIDISPLIPEAEFTTYGALNTLVPGEISEDGYLYA